MDETTPIRAVEMVRRIRDDLAREWANKSTAELLTILNQAGASAREEGQRNIEARRPTPECSRRAADSDGARLIRNVGSISMPPIEPFSGCTVSLSAIAFGGQQSLGGSGLGVGVDYPAVRRDTDQERAGEKP